MLTEQKAVVTKTDRGRLRDMIGSIRRSRLPVEHGLESYLRALEGQLARTTIVSPSTVQADTVTMNSKVCLREMETERCWAVTLAYEAAANPFGEKLSVLSELGASLLGSRVGDFVQWNTRRGRRHVRIERILFQPEAAGEFDL